MVYVVIAIFRSNEFSFVNFTVRKKLNKTCKLHRACFFFIIYSFKILIVYRKIYTIQYK